MTQENGGLDPLDKNEQLTLAVRAQLHYKGGFLTFMELGFRFHWPFKTHVFVRLRDFHGLLSWNWQGVQYVNPHLRWQSGQTEQEHFLYCALPHPLLCDPDQRSLALGNIRKTKDHCHL